MIAVLAMGALAGCGSKDEGASSDVTTYIAATEPTYAPFDTTDEDGNIVGFDMDLLNAIAEDQGSKSNTRHLNSTLSFRLSTQAMPTS